LITPSVAVGMAAGFAGGGWAVAPGAAAAFVAAWLFQYFFFQ
jgi:hypothetical protein